MSEEVQECCLCHAEFTGMGHNPEPIYDMSKRCCDHCNTWFVSPVRFLKLKDEELWFIIRLANSGGMFQKLTEMFQVMRKEKEIENA